MNKWGLMGVLGSLLALILVQALIVSGKLDKSETITTDFDVLLGEQVHLQKNLRIEHHPRGEETEEGGPRKEAAAISPLLTRDSHLISLLHP